MIKKHNSGLWTVDHGFQVMGIPLTTRMTLARISDNQWAVISPVPLTDADLQQIDAHAKVCYIIAPNNFHHLFIKKAQAYWPDAELFVPTALLKKRPDLSSATLINAQQSYPWSEALVPLRIDGSKLIEEFVFWHPESSTLVATDLCFNMIDPPNLRLKLFNMLMGTLGGLKMSRMMKVSFRDRQAMQHSVEQLLQWPFNRLIVAHGEIVEQDAIAKLKTCFAWLLK